MNKVLRSEEIYEALLDEDSFAGLPNLIANSVGARSAVVHWRHPDQSIEMQGFSYFTAAYMEKYLRDFTIHDPWMKIAAVPPKLNTFAPMDWYVPLAQFERSVVVQDFINVEGDDTRHAAGAIFKTQWGEGLVTLMRGRSATPFTIDEIAPLQARAGDFRRMLHVRGELVASRKGEKTATGALDTLALGAIVVRRNLRVVRTNQAAEEFLRERAGLYLKGGVVRCDDVRAEKRLAHAVGCATATEEPTAGAVRITSGTTRQDCLKVTVSPLVGNGALALIIFRRPNAKDHTLAHRLSTLFKLTPVEASIAIDLSDGFSPALIAERRDVRVATIKTHMASLYGKLGCSRQAEVAALVAGMPPLMSTKGQGEPVNLPRRVG